MQSTELTQDQREALHRCYSYLLQRRIARLAKQHQKQRTVDSPRASETFDESTADSELQHPSGGE